MWGDADFPKNFQDFENIQFPTSHLEAENPFGLFNLYPIIECNGKQGTKEMIYFVIQQLEQLDT